MNIISEHKKRPRREHRSSKGELITPIKSGFKRVQAIVEGKTRHIDIRV